MDPLLQAILNSTVVGTIVSAGGVIVAKILDGRAIKRAEKLKEETQEQSSQALDTANAAQKATNAQDTRIVGLEATISQLWIARESDRKQAEQNFKDLDAMRAEHSELSNKYYQVKGQFTEQAEQLVQIREDVKKQEKVIEGLKAWQTQATQRMDEQDSALAEAFKAIPDLAQVERIQGIVKTPRPQQHSGATSTGRNSLKKGQTQEAGSGA